MEVRFRSCCCIRETIIQKELATIGIRNNRTAVIDRKSVRAVLFVAIIKKNIIKKALAFKSAPFKATELYKRIISPPEVIYQSSQLAAPCP